MKVLILFLLLYDLPPLNLYRIKYPYPAVSVIDVAGIERNGNLFKIVGSKNKSYSIINNSNEYIINFE
jgi:hypothetical protein